MSDKKHISYERRGTQITIYLNREGIVEEKDRCVLSITEADARKDATIISVCACIMMLFAIVAINVNMKDSPIVTSTGKIFLSLIFVLLGSYVCSAWYHVHHRPGPIILTTNGISIPKKDEILWGDIEKIYFRHPFSQRGTTKMYIKCYEQRQIEVKGWSAYASKEQWLELLPKYAKRDIVDTDSHWF